MPHEAVHRDAGAYRFCYPLGMLWVAVVITIQMTSQKLTDIGSMTVAASSIIYFITYLFSDLFTEVYGYKNSRKIIWLGFGGMLMSTLLTSVMVSLPSSHIWDLDESYNQLFGQIPQIALGMYVAFLLGELTNAKLMHFLGKKFGGRWLFSRMLLSTLVGQAVDNLSYVFIAYAGSQIFFDLLKMAVNGWIVCVVTEAFFMPLSRQFILWIKNKESEHLSTSTPEKQVYSGAVS